MSSEAAFLEAALPEPQILLHQQLQPYSIGHEIILRRLKSPFLCQAPYTSSSLRGKLYTGIFVCCHSFDEAVAGLRDPQLPEQFRRWQKLCGRFDLNAIVLKFLEYVKKGREGPDFTPFAMKGQSFKPGAPFVLMLLNVLQGSLGYSRTEALNCPFGLARWHYVSWWESQGRLRLQGNLGEIRKQMAMMGMEPIKINGS